MSRVFAISIAAALLTACATPPAIYQVTKSRDVAVPYDQAWDRAVAYFASKNIQIKNIAKDSGLISAETGRFDNTVADCGQPGIAAPIGRRGNFNIYIARGSITQRVTVNTEFQEIRKFDTETAVVDCNSTGAIESAILTAIAVN